MAKYIRPTLTAIRTTANKTRAATQEIETPDPSVGCTGEKRAQRSGWSQRQQQLTLQLTQLLSRLTVLLAGHTQELPTRVQPFAQLEQMSELEHAPHLLTLQLTQLEPTKDWADVQAQVLVDVRVKVEAQTMHCPRDEQVAQYGTSQTKQKVPSAMDPNRKEASSAMNIGLGNPPQKLVKLWVNMQRLVLASNQYIFMLEFDTPESRYFAFLVRQMFHIRYDQSNYCTKLTTPATIAQYCSRCVVAVLYRMISAQVVLLICYIFASITLLAEPFAGGMGTGEPAAGWTNVVPSQVKTYMVNEVVKPTRQRPSLEMAALRALVVKLDEMINQYSPVVGLQLQYSKEKSEGSQSRRKFCLRMMLWGIEGMAWWNTIVQLMILQTLSMASLQENARIRSPSQVSFCQLGMHKKLVMQIRYARLLSVQVLLTFLQYSIALLLMQEQAEPSLLMERQRVLGKQVQLQVEWVGVQVRARAMSRRMISTLIDLQQKIKYKIQPVEQIFSNLAYPKHRAESSLSRSISLQNYYPPFIQLRRADPYEQWCSIISFDPLIPEGSITVNLIPSIQLYPDGQTHYICYYIIISARSPRTSTSRRPPTEGILSSVLSAFAVPLPAPPLSCFSLLASNSPEFQAIGLEGWHIRSAVWRSCLSGISPLSPDKSNQHSGLQGQRPINLGWPLRQWTGLSWLPLSTGRPLRHFVSNRLCR